METARSESGELLSRHPAREVEHVLLAGKDPHAHKPSMGHPQKPNLGLNGRQEFKWRRGWDLNPRARFCQATRFRGGLFQPLRHLSASTACRKITRGMRKGQRFAAMPVETALDCRDHSSRSLA